MIILQPELRCNILVAYIIRIVQNMSQFDLHIHTLHQLPDYPNLGQTLLFIQTHRFCPVSSTISLGHSIPPHLEDPEDEQLSLDIKLQNANHETINSATLIKKKKGGCTCKKTKCLKMYCECFSSGRMCTAECACSGCSNCEGHTQAIARAKQVIQIKTAAISRTNGAKGCTCKKTQCRKKYCECFNAGHACGEDCKCEDCLNGQCDGHEKQGRNEGKMQVGPTAELLSSKVNL